MPIMHMCDLTLCSLNGRGQAAIVWAMTNEHGNLTVLIIAQPLGATRAHADLL